MSCEVSKCNLAIIAGPQGPRENQVTRRLTSELSEPVFTWNLHVRLIWKYGLCRCDPLQ